MTIIKFDQLTHVTEYEQSAKLDDEIIQPILKAKFEDQDCFFKGLPKLSDPRLQKIRIINEAIYGNIAEIINAKLKHQFVTPQYKLVVDNDNNIIGLVTIAIPYHFVGDYSTSKKDLAKLLQCKAFAVISAMRYVFGDPDAANNIGYIERPNNTIPQLSSIDYGLAGLNTLLKLNALLAAEKEKFEASAESFQINISNMIAGPLQTMEDVEFLAIHIFGYSAQEYLEKIQSETPDFVNNFIGLIDKASHQIATIIADVQFKDSVLSALSYDNLSIMDKEIFDELFSGLELKAKQLKDTEDELRYCTPVEFEELKQVIETKNTTIANAVLNSPRLFGTRHVNVRAHTLVEDETKRLTPDGRISPANGGNYYNEILKPIPLYAMKRTVSAPERKQLQDEKEDSSRSITPFTL